MSTGLILLITGVISLGLAIVAESSTGDRKKWFRFLSVSFLGVFMTFVARDIWWPLEDGDRELSTESLFDGNPAGRLVDEVMLHVVDECDLYRTYQKNRIDFDPIEVGVSLIPSKLVYPFCRK